MMLAGKSHLCYSLNVFPEKDWLEDDSRIMEKVLALRKEITGTDSAKFAVGLWFDAERACEFRKKDKLQKLKKWLDKNNLYVFTFNAFPYGNFHGKPVKKKVYLPDWTMLERLEYTKRIADILSVLLPDGTVGSISSLPGAYEATIKSEKQIAKIVKNLHSAAEHLQKIFQNTGKKIILGVEPEPDCLWESADEFIEFYNRYFADADENVRKHFGICYDTCHQEVVSGEAGRGLRNLIKNRIPVAKIQLSAALKAGSPESKKSLANFADKVYLHQARVMDKNGKVKKYADLPDAMKSEDKKYPWLIHYHIPVFSSNLSGGLRTAKDELKEVLRIIAGNAVTSNLEIETYTFFVLPESMRKAGALKTIRKEYEWVLRCLKRVNPRKECVIEYVQ